ncbi:UDP-glycosyltransferase 87A1-like [Lycium ferocissimum]|uniref:UDP-glycosyltransferase 87A1-like n=1 Tax=Lycium ferocissimum TaxID=112874 RepID=UPI0028154E77|nr:UDP-glycosyltransferase 87A1-like [Lycium ferocissimum]
MEHSSKITCHIVAMPYPGRGHINPMMNFCKIIVTKNPNIFITFIVTEEWHSFIKSDILPDNIKYATIPNVIPSEIGRAKDFAGFIRATLTKLEDPVEKLIDGLCGQLMKPSVIVYDTHMNWVVGLGNRMNIPVASFFTMSATVFSVFLHMDLLAQNGHFKAYLTGKIQEQVDYIPGIPSIRVLDLPTPFQGKGQELLDVITEIFSTVSKPQYLLFTSVYELESSVIDALKQKFPTPVYSVGPAIPYFTSEKDPSATTSVDEPEYIKWLNAQPNGSVLYISQGSFLSVTCAELDEIVAGVHDSGIRFFWVARDETVRFQKNGCGLVVPWCDQLKVLSHPSIGGFWSHCGWNSTKEAAFSGLPMLTFPIFWDQQTNSKQIVEDWKIGYRVKKDNHQSSITREEISSLLKWFMDSGNDEVMETRRRAKEMQKICQCSTAKGGSSEINIDSFIKDVFSIKNGNGLGL